LAPSRSSKERTLPRQSGKPDGIEASPFRRLRAGVRHGHRLLYVFYFKLRWAPAPSYVPLSRDPLAWAAHLVLAWVTVATIYVALYARMLRSMREVAGEGYVRTARAKGLSERRMVLSTWSAPRSRRP